MSPWSVERTDVFFSHSPSFSLLSPSRTCRLWKLLTLLPCCAWENSLVLSLFLDEWHSQWKVFLSFETSGWRSIDRPSADGWELLGSCYVVFTPFLDVRKTSLSPAFRLILLQTVLVHTMFWLCSHLLLLDISVHLYTVLSVGLSHVISSWSLSRPISARISSSSLSGSPLWAFTFTRRVTGLEVTSFLELDHDFFKDVCIWSSGKVDLCPASCYPLVNLMEGGFAIRQV